MKYTATESNRLSRYFPATGDLWHHPKSDSLYLRIDQKQGEAARPDLNTEDHKMFSIDLDTGQIVFSFKNSKFIQFIGTIEVTS